jgi:hypothetical protein
MTATIVIDGDPSKVNVNGYVKGDILAADATGFLHALPVGPNTDVLTADSVQTEGLKYGPGGGGGIPVPFVLTPQNLVEAPTNPSDGQMVMWEITQDVVGNHTLTLASGAGGFLFGSGLTSITLSTAGGKTDLIGCRYNLAANRWWVIAFLGGF